MGDPRGPGAASRAPPASPVGDRLGVGGIGVQEAASAVAGAAVGLQAKRAGGGEWSVGGG